MASYRDRLPVVGGGGAVIKSVQRGYATLVDGASSTSVAINAVDMSSSIVLISFCTASGTDTPSSAVCSVRLASPTSLLLYRATKAPTLILVSWQVIEYESGVSVQRGTIYSTGGTSFSTSISPVAVSKSHTVHTSSPEGSTSVAVRAQVCGGLSSSTGLTFNRYTDYGPISIDWQVASYV